MSCLDPVTSRMLAVEVFLCDPAVRWVLVAVVFRCGPVIRWVLAVVVFRCGPVTRWVLAVVVLVSRCGPVIRWVLAFGSVPPGLYAFSAGRSGSWGGQERPVQDQAFPRRTRTGTMLSPILEDSS
jgi:hypothetical protein